MTERDVRYVVIHAPGPSWKQNLPFAEQAGVKDHTSHYRSLLERGILALGGPFVDNTGGMMIAASGLSREEVVRHAAEDPAVQSGLLQFEVRPWLIMMQGQEFP